MTNEQVLTQYVQELTNQRTQLEFNILSLKGQVENLQAEIERLKNPDANKQEGSDQGPSPQ